MARFSSLIPDREIENAADDFRTALKVEQYRIGKAAVYLPAGLRWKYIPLAEIQNAGDSYRSVTAGHCVTVTERKPAVEIITAVGSFTLNLEKIENVQKICDMIR